MSDLAFGATGFVVLLVLIALRVPIGVAMIVVGMVGYASIAGIISLQSFLKTEMYWRFSSFDFSVIPLFLIMGNFANRAGITAALFRAASSWIGHFRGGLAMAAIGGCAAFGTISGSSLATAAMMGQVSLPELRRYRYASGFATGALAAGGTLGILIPPSIPLIIYAIMVEGNIVELFQGAFVPGIFATVGTSPSSSLWCVSTRRPDQPADGRPWRSGGPRWAIFGRLPSSSSS
jgi:C4-dicarboxylate transporter DctM subunit